MDESGNTPWTRLDPRPLMPLDVRARECLTVQALPRWLARLRPSHWKILKLSSRRRRANDIFSIIFFTIILPQDILRNVPPTNGLLSRYLNSALMLVHSMR